MPDGKVYFCIARAFEKGIENVKLFEIDKLVNKYGVGNPLLVKKINPLIILDESQHDYFLIRPHYE